ncbi:MAG TPA: SCO family protein [Candidatus Binataceae bacterium]|nr:SCO family protein [Candidatus Binataceae bacterium]
MDKSKEGPALLRQIQCYTGSRVLALVLAIALALPGFVALAGCKQKEERTGAYAPSSENNCLPDILLTDQNGKKVSLSSLKGKPVLFDFIYTTCPGPCLMLTSKMRVIANKVGPELGSKVWFVSVTVDPEHDGPAQLLDYSKQQSADESGWLFLTGTPAQIDQVMSQFKLVRQREADGTVDHVLEFFLVGPDGRQLYQYAASHTDVTTIADDIDQAIRTGTVSSRDISDQKAHL